MNFCNIFSNQKEVIPLGGTKLTLRRTLYQIFSQRNLLTKKKVFHRLEVAFSVKTRAKQSKKSIRRPGIAILLQALCHHRLFISRPDANARRKREEH